MKSELNHRITICFVVAAIFLFSIPVLVAAQVQSGPLELKIAAQGGITYTIHLNYEISGATITKSQEDPDPFNHHYYDRKIEGVVDSDKIRIRATATIDQASETWMTWAAVVVDGKIMQESKLGKSGVDNLDVTVPVLPERTYDIEIQLHIYPISDYWVSVTGPLQYNPTVPVVPKEDQESGGTGPQITVRLSKDLQLKKLLQIYKQKIPKGITSSGSKNNLLSLGSDGEKYDEFKCGGYQSRVLKLLDSLKFSSDPEERALLDDWDYGPIQALWGGHQAVVIYPKGTDWVDDGIVLDPWIEQSPEAYSIHTWADFFSKGTFNGIGGSSVYEGTPEYPTVGGNYVDPNNKKRSQKEIDFIKGLSPEKKAIYQSMTEDQKSSWVKVKMAEQDKGGRAIGYSPLNLYLTDDSGKISGFPNGVPTWDMPEVSILRIPLSDGTYWTELEYPQNISYNLKIDGTKEGEADVFTGFGFDDIGTRSVYKYHMKIGTGQKLEAKTSSKGSSLSSSSKSVDSEEIRDISEVWLDSKPEIVEPPEYEVDAQGYTDSGTSSEPSEGTSSVISEGENKVIFNNWNTGSVDNSPSCAPTFTLSEPQMITYIDTYHWNYGSGTNAGGTVVLRDHDGKEYGPWQVETKSGQGGVPNAWWIAHPNEVIPAGTYGVVDSEQSTWSQNAESEGCGFSKVEGYPVKDMSMQQPQPEEITGESRTTSAGGQKEVGDSGLLATEDNPKDAEGWYAKGYNLARLGKYNEAIKAYDEAISLDPEYVNAWYAKGNNLNNLGRYNEAIEAYDGAIRLDPKYENAWYGKGVNLKKLERYDEAIKAYDEAIRLDPKDAKAWCAKGNALDMQGKYDEAIENYDEAIRLDPQGANAWYAKGNALNDLGRYDEAIKAYDEAIRLDPKDANAWYAKGNALSALGRYNEAINSYDEAIRLDPQDANARYAKGVDLKKQSKYDEASSPMMRPSGSIQSTQTLGMQKVML